MSKIILTAFMLPLLLLFAPADIHSGNSATNKSPANQGQSGTLQKMIVASGSVTMEIDLNRLNGNSAAAGQSETASSRTLSELHFAVAPNSFFPVLVFNNVLRGPEPGSMGLVPQNSVALPTALTASLKRLAIEKVAWSEPFDMAVRDAMSGFVFFNIQGHQYDYDANAQLLSITGGRLLVSKEFAESLGRPSDAGAVAGEISIGTTMQPVEITQLDENGGVKSATLPALNQPGVGTVPGPDVIVGDLIGLVQSDNGSVGGRVGLALGTDACNQGTVNVDWLALPSNDHPFIPQNVYRMSGGADNIQQFEQIGQSWGKHAFAAASSNSCGFGCNGVGGDHLGSGCSDAYGAGLNGDQFGIGSRAWVNPFTGNFPSGSTANDHSGHSHDVTSHRILVDVNDLNTSLNSGALYFAEAQYVVPHEYTWCQSHPGQCNMYNNASYRRYSVTGINQPFSFSPVGSTVREQPAIMAWTGATVNQVQPDPGNDGIWFMGYKVSNPAVGVWHYEYALYNENLDRAIQSFSVPLGPGVNISNIGFHAPPQHPGWANDGTFNNQGYSSTPWNVTQDASSITWSTETFAQNQNANAIRFGTLYNFRFDSDQAPHTTTATVGFFKTGAPIPVLIQAPVLADATPTPTPTASPTVTPTPTPTPSPCDTGIILNGGFETGDFTGWTIDGNNPTPEISSANQHGGTYSAFAGGDPPSAFCGNGSEPTGDSSFYQEFAVPADGGTLSFWHWDCTTDSITFDWQDAYVTDTNGNILQTIFHQCNNILDWVNTTVDMAPYSGQTVRVKFLVHEDGFGDLTGMYVDDVVLYQPCGTPTPTPTPTPTATATATPTATPTPRPTPTARPSPVARSRPTPAPRP